MAIMDELINLEIISKGMAPHVYCKAYEDNASTLEIARTTKIRPRTKHINIVYHHFLHFVRTERIQIYPIATDEQFADIFMKPLRQNVFLYLRKTYLKW